MRRSLTWEYYQNEQPEVFLGARTRLEFLAKKILPPARVLNIGIGSGLFEEIGQNRGLEVFSVDPSAKAVEALRQRLDAGEKAKEGSVEDLPFSGDHFDAVVISEVLEHLSDEVLEKGLREIARVLRQEGKIIGTVPAREDLDEQLIVCPECGKRFHRWGHLQSFTVTRMKTMLERYFVVGKVIERPFVAWGQLNWKGSIVAVVRRLLCSFGLHGSNENIVFIASKNDE